MHRPATRTNLIAIAAPVGSGEYMRAHLERILIAAYTGFAAAIAETERLWPGAPTEIRTGFWGCGAFSGNREVMVILHLLAARLAGAARLRFHAFDDAGLARFAAGSAVLERVARPGEPLGELIERIYRSRPQWGTSNGN